MRKQLPIVHFVDKSGEGEGFALVAVYGAKVGITLSLQKNGDIDVWVGAEELDEIIKTLVKARGMLNDEVQDDTH